MPIVSRTFALRAQAIAGKTATSKVIILKPLITSDKLAYWYFRLNGFMTLENFILHDDSRKGLAQKTDADLYGVRFPYRNELNMPDEKRFEKVITKPLCVIVEVKAAECKLNGPWTDPSKRNMQYVLEAVGAWKQSLLEEVATELYKDYAYEDEDTRVELLAVGSRTNNEYLESRPKLNQILCTEMLQFIYKRFNEFRMQKRDHQQWDDGGQYLYETAEKDEPTFVSLVLQEAGLLAAQ